MSTGELVGMIAVIAFSVVFFGLLLVGLVLVIRDTRRGQGRWGINTRPAGCTECGTPAPVVRVPSGWRQALWGGWTCGECGLELDKWGRPCEDQPGPAKWSALRGADRAQRREGPRRPDRRIRRPGDETRTGDDS